MGRAVARDVIVANWNGGKAKESLAFFDGRGHRQLIAGYYDVDDLSNFQTWDAAARDIKGVLGFMYTTWEHKYGLLETYGQALQAARRPVIVDGPEATPSMENPGRRM